MKKGNNAGSSMRAWRSGYSAGDCTKVGEAIRVGIFCSRGSGTVCCDSRRGGFGAERANIRCGFLRASSTSVLNSGSLAAFACINSLSSLF